MRQIRFRAWHDGNDEMVYFNNSIVKKDHVQASYLAAIMDGDFGDVLMQLTGLKDKNGKEIYEGDIVKSVSEIIKPFEKKHRQNTGRVSTKYLAIEYRDGVGSFCIVGSSLTSIYQKTASKYYEVVGNIHQNPELLEVK